MAQRTKTPGGLAWREECKLKIIIERKKGEPTHGNTDYERLKKMTEEDINRNAEEDEDLPLQSDEDLKRFKKINPKKE